MRGSAQNWFMKVVFQVKFGLYIRVWRECNFIMIHGCNTAYARRDWLARNVSGTRLFPKGRPFAAVFHPWIPGLKCISIRKFRINAICVSVYDLLLFS
jgi:hypothetical protein